MEEVVWSSPSVDAAPPEWIVPVEAIATLNVSDSENADPLGRLVATVGPEAWNLPPYLGETDRIREAVVVDFAPPHAQSHFTKELARVEVKIKAGERSVVELPGVTLGEPEPKTDVTIELTVSPEWNLGEFFLRLSPLKAGWETERREWTEVDLAFDFNGVVSVEAADVVVGTYLLEFIQVDLLVESALVEVSEAESALRLAAPDPTELRLWVVDADSGANLDVTRLMVGPPTPKGAQGRVMSMGIPKRSPTGSLVLMVPGGQRILRLQLADGRYAKQTLHITQNPTEVVVEVRGEVPVDESSDGED